MSTFKGLGFTVLGYTDPDPGNRANDSAISDYPPFYQSIASVILGSHSVRGLILSTQKVSLDTNDGTLSATLNHANAATHMLLLAHGAGADHQHAHMTSLAEAFAQQQIITLRFNFPFKQLGRSRVDSKQVSMDCILAAADWLQNNISRPLLVGGHSFGGRMATHAVVEKNINCKAMVLCSFPLHSAGKPSTDRANHIKNISQPIIFLSGTRDKLADQSLLDDVVGKLNPPNVFSKSAFSKSVFSNCLDPQSLDTQSLHTKSLDQKSLAPQIQNAKTRLHWLETGDHSFKILKRSRINSIDIYTEAAIATREFLDEL